MHIAIRGGVKGRKGLEDDLLLTLPGVWHHRDRAQEQSDNGVAFTTGCEVSILRPRKPLLWVTDILCQNPLSAPQDMSPQPWMYGGHRGWWESWDRVQEESPGKQDQ